jgi:Uri superfamily endonuclease
MAAADQGLTSAPGLYALALYLPRSVEIAIGALGAHLFPAGSYVYVGSAWGPGGLAARLQRHLRGADKRHWHIDYLRAWAAPQALWWAEETRDECGWAERLLTYPGADVVVPRFGASDCSCPTHLAYVGDSLPTADLFPTAHYRNIETTTGGM